MIRVAIAGGVALASVLVGLLAAYRTRSQTQEQQQHQHRATSRPRTSNAADRRDDVSGLRSRVFRKVPKSKETKNMCMICESPLCTKPKVKITCGHEFHETCLKDLWEKNEGLCEICRRFENRIDHNFISADALVDDSENDCSLGSDYNYGSGITGCMICKKPFGTRSTVTISCVHQFHEGCLKHLWEDEYGYCEICKTYGHRIENNFGSPNTWNLNNSNSDDSDNNLQNNFDSTCSMRSSGFKMSDLQKCVACKQPIAAEDLLEYPCRHAFHQQCVDLLQENLFNCFEKCFNCMDIIVNLKDICNADSFSIDCTICETPLDQILNIKCDHKYHVNCLAAFCTQEICHSCHMVCGNSLLSDLFLNLLLSHDNEKCVFCGENTDSNCNSIILGCGHAYHNICHESTTQGTQRVCSICPAQDYDSEVVHEEIKTEQGVAFSVEVQDKQLLDMITNVFMNNQNNPVFIDWAKELNKTLKEEGLDMTDLELNVVNLVLQYKESSEQDEITADDSDEIVEIDDVSWENETVGNCTLCYDLLSSKPTTRLECGHVYHTDCLDFLWKSVNQACDICVYTE